MRPKGSAEALEMRRMIDCRLLLEGKGSRNEPFDRCFSLLGLPQETTAETGRTGRLTRQTPSGALAQANSRTEEGIGRHPVERRKGSRFPDRFVDPEARSPGDSSGIWGDIPSGICVVHPQQDGMEPPEARVTSAGAR